MSRSWRQAAGTLDHEAFVGLIVNSSVQGEYLDSPRADDFFAMAAELDAPVFLHPPPSRSAAARSWIFAWSSMPSGSWT
jgi:predicted TIM-barrel fold metal-dependent hydrolase